MPCLLHLCTRLQNRQSAMPHVLHQLWQLVGKPVGKAPAHYKPRGPRSPPAGGATPADQHQHQHQAATQAAAPHTAYVPPAAAPAAAAGMTSRQSAAAGAAAHGYAEYQQQEDGGGIGPAAAAAARAAATATGEVLVRGAMDPSGAMNAVLKEYPTDLVRLAALVRRALALQKGVQVHMRLMLKTGLLAGQVSTWLPSCCSLTLSAVRCGRPVQRVAQLRCLLCRCSRLLAQGSTQPSLVCSCCACCGLARLHPAASSVSSHQCLRVALPVPSHLLLTSSPSSFFLLLCDLQEVRFQTKSGRVQNHGVLKDGAILCFCKQCGSAGREVSASEFEEHSGSKDRRPADGIFLQCEFAQLAVGVGCACGLCLWAVPVGCACGLCSAVLC
jgi:hypothetical protein